MLRHAAILAPSLALLLIASASAVQPEEWVHQTEADFTEGEPDGVVVTNLGEVRLARGTPLIASVSNDEEIIYDVAQLDDGRVFLALGAEGRLAELEDDSINVIESFDGEQIFSLTTDGEALYVGVSGASSRVEVREGEEMAVAQTVELEETRYVWDLLLAGDRLYAATGTEGTVFAIDTEADEAAVTTALDARPDNILTLAADGDGRVYAGTDGEGLVYRLTRQDDGGYESFVLYDADEPEIGALVVREDGTVFAGTADADQARPGRLEAAREESTGRPESVSPDNGDDADEGDLPDAPPVPEPEPEPDADADDADDAADAEQEEQEQPSVVDEPEGPTAEQYEQLRQVVRDRLSEASESGRVPTQSAPEPRARAESNGPSMSRAGGGSRSGGGSRQGNAIYRIDPEGFVSEVFRESVMILDILEQDDALIVATGNQGQLYRVDPADEEVAILADLDPQQIPALFESADGDVLLGTANPGLLFELSSGVVAEGTLTSEPLDADQVSRWGKLRVKAANDEGTVISVRTRSGNVSDPELGGWSDWSDPQAIELTGGQSAFLDVTSPSARFLQYRVTLRSEEGASPTLYQIALRYLMPNLAPQISSLTAEYPDPNRSSSRSRDNGDDGPQAQTELNLEWEAEDANEDSLRYTIEARTFGTDDPFVTIAEDVTSDSYEWDTRTLPDGRYVLRLTASDADDNIPAEAMTATRRSDPVTVDNTPPEFQDVAVEVNEDGDAELSLRVTDAVSPLHEVRYRVSGEDKWRLVLPEDYIYDSTEETVDVTISDLAPGARVLSLRATDVQGNTRHVSQTFSVPR